MASFLKLISTNVISAVNRGFLLQTPSIASNQIACSSNVSKYNKIVQKLGLPEPPKRPLGPYIRFQKDNLESLQKITKSQRDLFAKCSEKWKLLPEVEKEKYKAVYRKEYEQFQKINNDYKNKLTPDQKKAIKAERKLRKETQVLAANAKTLKNEQRDLGKPKRSLNAFMLYAMKNYKAMNLKPAELKDHWVKLSDDQKKVFNLEAQRLRDNYENELKIWEDKMMKDGKGHLVRKCRFLTKTDDEGKRRKKKNTD